MNRKFSEKCCVCGRTGTDRIIDFKAKTHFFMCENCKKAQGHKTFEALSKKYGKKIDEKDRLLFTAYWRGS